MNRESNYSKTTYRYIFGVAWPIMIANAAVPLLGLTDTAVIGRGGTVEELGAIAIGALIFSFVYWSFGFLRMGTTGFVAQASGAGNEIEVRATLGRALLMAVGLGVLLITLQLPIAWLAFRLLSGPEAVESIARKYFFIRIWGAPATLCSFALLGAMIGLRRTRALLGIQVFLNGLNIALDVLFAGVLGWGAVGIAVGTLIAEWSAAILACVLVFRILRRRHRDTAPFLPWARLRDMGDFWRTVGAHTDIMIRTVLMLVAFGWFTRQGAKLGEATLAANHVLLQFVSFSAFFLDGYAFATESLVGTAVGARDRDTFDLVVMRSSVLAGVTGVLLAMCWWNCGPVAIRAMTDLAEVRTTAELFLIHAAVYVALSSGAFQLDGIFIGATRTRDMRNASLVSVVIFLGAGWPLVSRYANTGLWLAFIAYVVVRALTLAVLFPRLRKSLGREV